MDLLIHQILSGLATGGIYASVALALVMIYQATHLVNFAQGEIAMFATYLAWTLIQAGMPYWGAFFLTVFIAFVGGVVLERVVIQPVENAPILSVVIVFIGLLVIFNSVAGWIYSYTIKSVPSPFPSSTILGGDLVAVDAAHPHRQGEDDGFDRVGHSVFSSSVNCGVGTPTCEQWLNAYRFV